MSADRDAKAAQALDHGKLREEPSESKAAIGPQPEAEYPKRRFAAGQIVETGVGRSHADAVAMQDPTDRVAAVGSISDKTRSRIPGASMLTSDLVDRFAALSSVVDRARVDALGVRVVVFVDGDFWHGRNIKTLKPKLRQGHNAEYWVRKIEGNAARDQDRNRELSAAGWLVLRVWESDVYADLDGVVCRVESALGQHAATRSPGEPAQCRGRSGGE